MVKVDKFYIEVKLDDIRQQFDEAKKNGKLPDDATEKVAGNPGDGYVISFLCNGGKLVGKTYNSKVVSFNKISDDNQPYYLYQFVREMVDKFGGELVASIDE